MFCCSCLAGFLPEVKLKHFSLILQFLNHRVSLLTSSGWPDTRFGWAAPCGVCPTGIFCTESRAQRWPRWVVEESPSFLDWSGHEELGKRSHMFLLVSLTQKLFLIEDFLAVSSKCHGNRLCIFVVSSKMGKLYDLMLPGLYLTQRALGAAWGGRACVGNPFWLLLMWGSVCFSQSRESGGGDKKDVIELTDDSFDKNVINSDDVWMVEFYAPWCGHCKK